MAAVLPTLETFLHAPLEQIRSVAPATMIFAPGGTRRRAALAGISPQSENYAHWSRMQMLECCDQWFEHGVQHLFMNVLRPAQLAETGYYRERVLGWLSDGLAGDSAIEEYERRGWRVRLFGTQTLPELQPAATRLANQPAKSGPTLWFFVVPDLDAPYQWLRSAVQHEASSSADAMMQLYGEHIPLATLFVGFGKPLIAPDLLPPLLAGELQCYWTQRPGYDADPMTIRQILYDYANLRRTWVSDKSTRYDDVSAQRAIWETSRILGVGQRIGSFWYPHFDEVSHSEELT